MPTIPNFALKHGSLKGFFEEHNADVVCFQVTTKNCIQYVQDASPSKIKPVFICRSDWCHPELENRPELIYMLLSFIIPFISTVTGNKAAERGKAHKGDGMC